MDYLATQKLDMDGKVNKYNYRDMAQVDELVNALSKSENGRKPLFSYWFGLEDNSPKGFIENIEFISDIYSKNTGIRLRGVITTISKDVFTDTDSKSAIIQTIRRLAEYYLYQGYLTGMIIYEYETYYKSYLIINPVSYIDGGKYRPNHHECLDHDRNMLEAIIANVTNGMESSLYDFTGLAAYPYL